MYSIIIICRLTNDLLEITNFHSESLARAAAATIKTDHGNIYSKQVGSHWDMTISVIKKN